MASSWIERRETKAGKPRYRVRFLIGGRESRPRYGGSFKTKTEAQERKALIDHELAAGAVPDMDRLLTFGQLASALEVPETELRNRWKSGELPAYLLGGPLRPRPRFSPADVVEALEEATGEFVYFISGGGFIKIGRSRDPRSRLTDLQVASPVPLILEAFIPGGRELEEDLHRHFAFLRQHGEWFADVPLLREFIADAKELERARDFRLRSIDERAS